MNQRSVSNFRWMEPSRGRSSSRSSIHLEQDLMKEEIFNPLKFALQVVRYQKNWQYIMEFMNFMDT